MHCPVCGSVMPLYRNAKGRLQLLCASCHTSVYVNNNAAQELGEFKKNILTKEDIISEINNMGVVNV